MTSFPRAVSSPVFSSIRRARFCLPTKKPGAMAFTRMPCGANSLAAAMVRLSTPALAAS